MKSLVLGIDGGGTKGHLALFRPDSTCAAAAKSGPLNHEGMDGSYAELESELGAYIRSALGMAGAGAGDVDYAVFGLAGVDTKAQHELISGIVRRLGIERFLLCNDAFLGVFAGCPECVGICAINGTGSSTAAVDRSGRAVQVGGIGGVSGDIGGGSHYGMMAISSVYNELFKLGRPTLMRGMVFELSGVREAGEYHDTLAAGITDGTLDSVALNSIVFDAADKGDEVALEILVESATDYAGGIAYLAKELDFPADEAIYVTFAGSVFVRQKVTLLPDIIKRLVEARLGGRRVEFLRLDAPPVAGAVYKAAREAGYGLDVAAIKAGIEAAGLR